jgi:hypothetical protein
MWMWCAPLTTRSRIDSATTGFGNSEYQSSAERFAVMIRLRPALSLISS